MASHYNHSAFRDARFTDRFFKHKDVCERLTELAAHAGCKVELAGHSEQGREIFKVQIGTGDIPVLMWSQMHGDEATGTMAMFDMILFLLGTDHPSAVRDQILSACTLHLVPMLNPDGAEVFTRRNAQQIDINRDFLALRSSEARILTELQKQIRPEYGFNLHDKDILWTVSGTRLPSTISLVAPPPDALETITPTRLRAMKVIAGMFALLNEQIPGQIGRWVDEYEARSVGDRFQMLGVSTILIEAGGFANDPEKQIVRQLYYDAMVCALDQIAQGSYEQQDISNYHRIPPNTKALFHLVIRNCRARVDATDRPIAVDLGLNFLEVIEEQQLKRVYFVADIGDLSTWNAYQTIAAEEAEISAPIVFGARADFSLKLTDGQAFNFVDGILSGGNN